MLTEGTSQHVAYVNDIICICREQSRPQESEQDDKWSFCLTAGTLCQRIRRDDEQTTAPEPYTGLQGESGAGRHQGRSNACPTGGAFRCPPQSDYDMESATRR